MGGGGASSTGQRREDFHWMKTEEPHAARRKAIMKAHPEVSKLQGPEWSTKYLVVALTALQVWLSWAVTDLSWPLYLAAAYVFGATLTQNLFLAIHEISHNLAFKKPLYNRLLAMVANAPIIFPYSVVFRVYHLEHHKFQGLEGVDTDIPCDAECAVVRGPVTKCIWACLQILAYALRPCMVKPFDITPMVALNWVVQFGFDGAVFYFLGYKPLAFLTLCILLAGGLHPCAGHFISEHYVFPHLSDVQETYSYYGPLNWLTWNVGYHNEHHDFPYVPWSRLPALRRIAHEFYDDLAVCDSWCGVIYDYILRKEVGPYSRVKRKNEYSATKED